MFQATHSQKSLNTVYNFLQSQKLQKQTNLLYGKEKTSQSQKSIQSQQNSVHLMIRAHQRIRSLEQDNQILRMHNQLLSKDNKQLLKRLQQSQTQKNVLISKNAELSSRLRNMQLSSKKAELKQQILILQKDKSLDKIDKRQKQENKFRSIQAKELNKILQVNNYRQDTNYHSIASFKDLQTTAQTNQQMVHNQNCLIKEYFNQVLPKITISRQKQILSPENKKQITKNKSCYLFSQNEINKDFSLYNRAQKYLNRKNSTQSFHHNHQATRYREQQIHMDGVKKRMSNYQLRLDSPASKYHTISNFYQSEKKEVSPLIRKNSPSKYRNINCENHHKKSSYLVSQNQNSLTKKFNYTNWRKTNNNFMVWKGMSNSKDNKPISINR